VILITIKNYNLTSVISIKLIDNKFVFIVNHLRIDIEISLYWSLPSLNVNKAGTIPIYKLFLVQNNEIVLKAQF